jgi:EAL domain-containing protein (putative c-di-GMP-specific phosphodiesterase class I)
VATSTGHELDQGTGAGAGAKSAWPTRTEWRRAIRAVLDRSRPLLMHYQPIVELHDGTVVGYEALSRFPGPPPTAPPDAWFSAAANLGLGPELEALVTREVLGDRERLPPNTFVTLNVSPQLVTAPAMTRALLDEPADLHRVVIEVTEHAEIVDLAGTLGVLNRAKELGAKVAIDDAGAGYSGLRQVVELRPDFVKLDRSLVDGIDRDDVKRALAELLGEFGSRIDAWLLAEGVERDAELATIVSLGIPLAQGWLLHRGGPEMPPLDPAISGRIRSLAAARTLTEHVAALVEPVVTCPADEAADVCDDALGPSGTHELVVAVDSTGRPGGRMDRATWRARGPWAPAGLLVAPAAAPAEVLRRALARPPAVRFTPVLCTDRNGRLVGQLRMERLIDRLT